MNEEPVRAWHDHVRPAADRDAAFIYGALVAGLRPYVEHVWGWNDTFQSARCLDSFDPARCHVVIEGQDVVGGHRVTMVDLWSCFPDLGFADVRSYIQTGNVFFRSSENDRVALRQRIEAHREQALGWPAPTCLRTVEELEAVLVLDPFAGIELTAERRFAVTFFPGPHGIDVPLPHRTPKGGYEFVAATRTEVFVVWHLRDGRLANDHTAVGGSGAEVSTTRFWHTTAKILAAAKQAGS